MGEENFRFHIVGLHDSKDAQVRAKIELQAKFAVEQPRFIVRDVKFSGRTKYMSLADIEIDKTICIRSITVVVEANGNVVTWFARRTINDNLT